MKTYLTVCGAAALIIIGGFLFEFGLPYAGIVTGLVGICGVLSGPFLADFLDDTDPKP